MRKLILAIIGLLIMALVACAGNPEPTALPEDPPTEKVQPAAGPEGSGKPQLVEFYADW